MKSGMTLETLVGRIQNDAKSRRDFIADTSTLEWGNDSSLVMRMNGEGAINFRTNEVMRQQVASKIGIPKTYFDRMHETAPELLATNVNHWFRKESGKQMVRTLHGTARAFLSDRYRPLDNIDLAAAVLPQLVNSEFEVKSSEITEQRLYIQAVTQRIQGEVKVGDTVQAGVVISNSEVGCGSLRVEPLIYRLICLNGAIVGHTMRRAHLGGRFTGNDDAYELFTDKTKSLTDKAFWSQVQDVIAQTCTQDAFTKLLEGMKEAAKVEVRQPQYAVEVAQKRFGFSENESRNVLDNLIKAGDCTQYGLANAITALQHTTEDYDRSVMQARTGGEVLELPANDVIFVGKN